MYRDGVDEVLALARPGGWHGYGWLDGWQGTEMGWTRSSPLRGPERLPRPPPPRPPKNAVRVIVRVSESESESEIKNERASGSESERASASESERERVRVRVSVGSVPEKMSPASPPPPPPDSSASSPPCMRGRIVRLTVAAVSLSQESTMS